MRFFQAGEVPRRYSVVFLTVCLMDAFLIWRESLGVLWFSRHITDPGPMLSISCIIAPALVVVGLGGYMAKKRPGVLWESATVLAVITGFYAIFILGHSEDTLIICGGGYGMPCVFIPLILRMLVSNWRNDLNMRPKDPEEIDGAELLARARMMEKNGHFEAALASYRQIATRYSCRPIGRQAQTAFAALRPKQEKKDA